MLKQSQSSLMENEHETKTTFYTDSSGHRHRLCKTSPTTSRASTDDPDYAREYREEHDSRHTGQAE